MYSIGYRHRHRQDNAYVNVKGDEYKDMIISKRTQISITSMT